MAGTIIVSSIKTDTDNSFIVRSNTGATLFSVDTTSISIPDGSITSAMIANGTVIAADILDGTITAAKIADGNVTNAKIDSVANTKITGLVTSAQIANVANTQITGVLTDSQLANTAVTAGVYGGTTQIPAVTIDAQGRITSASNVAFSSTPTTAQVLTATSGASADAVGTYAFLRGSNGVNTEFNTNYAGSGLLTSSLSTGGSSAGFTVYTGASGSARSGTWKAMGQGNPVFSGSYAQVTLFLRVA